MKTIFAAVLFTISLGLYAQEMAPNRVFWEKLSARCGQAFEGQLISPPAENDPFLGKRLTMYIMACGPDFLHIPFYVGEDKSRTWVLTMKNGLIQLKHDHRHEDGSPDKVTQYGGLASNTGSATTQMFPADQETANLIPNAAHNLWWITVDDTSFTYNLRRIGTDRWVAVKFDLTKPVENPGRPWGW